MTIIRIEKNIYPCGQFCGDCDFLAYSTINRVGKAWICNAFDYRLSTSMPIGSKAQKRAEMEPERVRRCEQCTAFDERERRRP